MAEIRCLPILETTDGPLFGSKPGTLSALTNMRVRPGGYVEARGGADELKPSGGTATDAISAGAYSAVRQLSTSYGWVRSYDDSAAVGSQYSGNLQLHQGGVSPFGPTAALNDAMYWGADLPFNRIGASFSTDANWSVTLTYEYWNGASWSTLTTSETIGFGGRPPTFASWTMPTNWAASTVGDSGTGNVLKYWMRIRISAFTSVTTSPLIGLVQGFWVGMRELYVATQNPRSGAANGTLKRHGQSGTTEEWFSINSSLFSSTSSPARMVEYRGRIVIINGKESKRWDGANLRDLGIEVFIPVVLTHNLVPVAGGVLGAGIWRYYGAYGEGPCQNTAAYSDRQDVKALYGPGQAVFISQVTTAAAERVRFEIAGASPPTGISSFYLYRTDDLTSMPASDRPNAPAYLVQSFRIQSSTQFEQGLGGVGNYYFDDNLSHASPLQEALTFDVSPPPRCKYATIYQNRLILVDDEKAYISDPFQPDRFSTKATSGFVSLARASGGRHSGTTEFADQAILWTEDQTYGLTNLDLDVYQLFPVHPTIGCIAPDAAAFGDGLLIWPAKDGFYAWNGGAAGPKNISRSWDTTFGKMSFESHGASRAIIHDRQYIVRLVAPGDVSVGNAYAYDMDSGQWGTYDNSSSFSTILSPLAVIHAPLGNNDAGLAHPLWGKTDYTTAAGEYGLFLTELTTQDGGTNYTCSATMFFPQPPGGTFRPYRALAYYEAPSGWATPALSFSVVNIIGSAVGSINTGTPDTGTDYSVIGGTFSQVSSGSSDLKVTFTVSSAAGGTVNAQRLFGCIIEGQIGGFRRGGV